MLTPIIARDELVPQESVSGMCRLRRLQGLRQEIGAYPGNHHAMTLLRRAKIRRVNLDYAHLKVQVRTRSCQPINDRLQISTKLGPGQTSHILKQEPKGTNLAHSADRLRPHIAMIVVAAMLSTYTERLTRRAASHQVHTDVLTPVYFPDVSPDNWPILDVRHTSCTIVEHCRDGIAVPFDHQIMVESRSGKPQPKAATPGKQFDAAHDPSPS